VYNGKPDTALITFSSNKEAADAYSCPEALFNNRFIRINWYRDETEQVSTNPLLLHIT